MEASTLPQEKSPGWEPVPPPAPPQDEPQVVWFAARRSDLVLTRIPEDHKYTPKGDRVVQQPLRYYFASGRLVLKVDADDDLAWLRAHRLFGDMYEGFWELRPVAPDVGPLMAWCTQAAIRFDEEGLMEVRDRELAGWNRQAIVEMATVAINGIRRERVRAIELHTAEQEGRDPDPSLWETLEDEPIPTVDPGPKAPAPSGNESALGHAPGDRREQVTTSREEVPAAG